MLRNYYYKNILSFGDLIHKIHPLAGQGFNMTIRDIKILSKIVQERIDLGLQIDNSIYHIFENKTNVSICELGNNYLKGAGMTEWLKNNNIDNAARPTRAISGRVCNSTKLRKLYRYVY